MNTKAKKITFKKCSLGIKEKKEKIMHQPKRGRNKVHHNCENPKKKDNCPRCLKSINRQRIESSRSLISHKTACKSSKCLIHGKFYRTKIDNSKLKSKRESRIYKNCDGRKTLKVRIFNSLCAVDEFEEIGSNSEDIDKEMFAKIETVVEDSDFGKEIDSESVVGFGMIKEVIERTIIWPLKKPEIFKGLRTAPKGVLLFGPPGTGKTSLGRLIAFETKSTFFNVSPSTLISKWLGESEKLVRTMFVVAKARQPSVIFIDEVDSLLSHRISEENGAIRRMKNEFFICMDNGESMANEDRILVVGATNRPQELDEAARRRFFKRFYIPLPNKSARKEILFKLLEHECHSLEEIDVIEIANKTEGYSVADLKNLSQEAAMGPIKRLSKNAIDDLKPHNIKPISLGDFFCALQLIKPSVSKEQVQSYEVWDSMYGYGGEPSTAL